MKRRNWPGPRSKPAQLDQRAGGYVTLVSTHLSSLHSILSSARSPAPQKRGGGVGGCCCCALRRPRRSGDRRRRLRDSRGPSAAARGGDRWRWWLRAERLTGGGGGFGGSWAAARRQLKPWNRSTEAVAPTTTPWHNNLASFLSVQCSVCFLNNVL